MISSENEGDIRMLGKGDGMDYTELAAQADNMSMPLIKSMKAVPDSEEKFYRLLQKYVLIKLLLPADIKEESLYRLCMMSIQQQKVHFSAKDSKMLEKQMEKYDCHQHNAPLQKKVLLVMRLECELECKFTDKEAAACETVKSLAVVFYRKLCGKGEEKSDG